MKSIVIIGAGYAGYSLARELKKLNTKAPVHIITADDGKYYAKSLLTTALTNNKHPDALAAFDSHTMQKQLNASIITNTTATNINTQQKTIQLNSGQNIDYDKLVIACGAEVLNPNITGTGLDLIFPINSLTDYRKFRAALSCKKHVTILGSGLTGCEFANDLINAGIKVSLISLAECPLENLLPPAASKIMEQSLTKQGVDWHWQTTINTVDKNSNKKLKIKLSNSEVIESDLIISAIGIKPKISLAQQADLAINYGITVDPYLQTSHQDVYALGDCAEICGHVFQYAAPITHASRALAKTLTNTPTQLHYPAMHINIKTPSCPIILVPPPTKAEGTWEIQAAGAHIKATFIDQAENLLGFALTGDRIKERLQLTTRLPPLLAPQH